MFRCWHTDPEERLSFTDLVGLMSHTLATLGDYMEVCTFGALQHDANVEAADDNYDDEDEDGGADDADKQDGSDAPEQDKNDNIDIPIIEEAKL